MVILAVFLLQAIPVTYADTTWLMYGATLENTHFQAMRGAMSDTPYVKWSYQTGYAVESYGAAVADVNGDDTMEVIIGSCDSIVYCLNGITGKVKWSYKAGHWIASSPAVADVDRDDTLEVVVGSNDSTVYCLNGVTGEVKWSYKTGNWIFSSPTVADIDGDDTLEIVVGSGWWFHINNKVLLFRWSNWYCEMELSNKGLCGVFPCGSRFKYDWTTRSCGWK